MTTDRAPHRDTRLLPTAVQFQPNFSFTYGLKSPAGIFGMTFNDTRKRSDTATV